MADKKFRLHDAIIVIEGPFTSWVGYFKECLEDNYTIRVLLMDGDGNSDTVELPSEFVKNIEQPRRYADPAYDEDFTIITLEHRYQLTA